MALGLGTLLVLGSTSNVTAQAAESQGASNSPDLPQWVVDLHDAALAWEPQIGWGTARSSLAAAHWLLFPVPASKILVPEVTFTIEDGFPEVIASRILIPPSGEGAR